VPAWKTIPSFYLVGTIDKAIPPFAQLIMAQRINAHISEVRGSHLVMISHPEAVVDLINQAVHTMSANSNANSGLTLAPASL
jgi:pimeloyl-ACP methyl ester carboxylesterase